MTPTKPECPVYRNEEGHAHCPMAEKSAKIAAQTTVKEMMWTLFDVDIENKEDLKRLRGGMGWATDMFIMLNASKRRVLTFFLMVLIVSFLSGAAFILFSAPKIRAAIIGS